MNQVLVWIGACMLVAGALQILAGVAMRKNGIRGRAWVWAGTGFFLYGILLVTGLFGAANALSVVLMVLVISVVWTGVAFTIRDAWKSSPRQ
jgi:hypothetical protein